VRCSVILLSAQGRNLQAVSWRLRPLFHSGLRQLIRLLSLPSADFLLVGAIICVPVLTFLLECFDELLSYLFLLCEYCLLASCWLARCELRGQVRLPRSALPLGVGTNVPVLTLLLSLLSILLVKAVANQSILSTELRDLSVFKALGKWLLKWLVSERRHRCRKYGLH